MRINNKVQKVLIILLGALFIIVIPSVLLSFDSIAFLFLVFITFIFGIAYLAEIINIFIFIFEEINKRYKNLYDLGGKKRVRLEFFTWLLIGLGLVLIIHLIRIYELYHYWYFIPPLLLISCVVSVLVKQSRMAYQKGGVKESIKLISTWLAIVGGSILYFYLLFTNTIIVLWTFGLLALIIIVQLIRLYLFKKK